MRVLARLRQGILVLLLVGSAGYFVYARTPCKAPLQYTIGAFDTRFDISETELLSALEDAAAVWEDAAGENLFDYNPKGNLPVNLVYDSRQAITERNNELKESIDETTGSAEALHRSYESAQAKYDTAKQGYAAALSTYNAHLADYNEQIAYWNARGGAPAKEYKALTAQKAALEAEARTLEQKRLSVNALAQQSNDLGKQYNALVGEVNKTVDRVNETAGREFEEGLYTSSVWGAQIDIYEFGDRDKLVRVLAHEMGHALGLSHNSNPKSIMYETNQSENMVPTAEDIADLSAKCGV